MFVHFRQLATNLGTRALLKVASQLHGVFGVPDHYSTIDTPLLREVNSEPESDLGSTYPPQLHSPDLVDEEQELPCLRKEQDICWCQEHAERNEYFEEHQFNVTEPCDVPTQQIEQPMVSKVDHHVSTWEQQNGVLYHRGPDCRVKFCTVPQDIGEAQQAVAVWCSASDTESQMYQHTTHDTAEVNQSQPIGIQGVNPDGNSGGYDMLPSSCSSSSSSPRRHGAVRYRRNPLFYRDMPRQVHEWERPHAQLLSSDDEWILEYVSESGSDDDSQNAVSDWNYV